MCFARIEQTFLGQRSMRSSNQIDCSAPSLERHTAFGLTGLELTGINFKILDVSHSNQGFGTSCWGKEGDIACITELASVSCVMDGSITLVRMRYIHIVYCLHTLRSARLFKVSNPQRRVIMLSL